MTKIFLPLILLFSLASCLTPSMANLERSIPPHEKLLEGTLTNGMEYYILHNDQPSNKVEIRLIVDAGSAQEREDQRGLAHLLEHMAFNGTRDYPKNELVDYLQSLGVEFGPEVNAYTSFDETVYKLSVPSDRESLNTALHVMEQWAFHITLDPQAIEEERPVVIEEWRLSRDSWSRMYTQASMDIYRDSPYGDRMPIGTRENLENFDHQSLIDFYRDWYQPRNMKLLIVGDVSAKEAEEMIHRYFDSRVNDENAPLRRLTTIPSHDEDIFTLQRDEETPQGYFQIIKKVPELGQQNGEGYLRYVKERIYINLFNNRMDRLVMEENLPFISGGLYYQWDHRDRDSVIWGMEASPDDLAEAFKAYWREIKRVELYGFSEQEWNQAVEDLRIDIKDEYYQQRSIQSLYLMQNLQNHVEDDEVFPSPRWYRNFQLQVLNNLTQEEVLEATSHWHREGNRVFYSMELESQPPLTTAMLIQAMEEVEQEELQPLTQRESIEELIENPPQPGALSTTVTGQLWEEIQGKELTILTLDNGIKVYLLPVDNTKDFVLLRGVSPGGFSLLAPEDIPSSRTAADVVQNSGLADYTSTQLLEYCELENIYLQGWLNLYSEELEGSSSTSDLEKLLQLIYLAFTQPGYHPNRANSYMTRLTSRLEAQHRDPQARYYRMINEVLDEHQPYRAALTVDNLGQVDLERSYDIYRERMQNRKDWDFFITGDFRVNEIQPLLTQWLGALPVSPEEESWRYVEDGMTMEDQREILYMGQEEIAAALLSFTGPMEWSYQEQYKLNALASAMTDRLTEVIREEEGGTYSIYASNINTRLAHEEYVFYIEFSCDPLRVDELTNQVHEVIEYFQRGEGLEIYAQNVQAAEILSLEENQQNIYWWHDRLIQTYAFDLDQSFPRDTTAEELIEMVDGEVLAETARRYLGEAEGRQLFLHLPEDLDGGEQTP